MGTQELGALSAARKACISALQDFFWDWNINGWPNIDAWNTFVKERVHLGRELAAPAEDSYDDIETLDKVIRLFMSHDQLEEWKEYDERV